MLTTPDYATTYNGCELKVFKDREAWWCRVLSSDPPWQMITMSPKSDPQSALISGEMEVLKTQALLDDSPVCLCSYRSKLGEERILFQNPADLDLFRMDSYGMLASDFVEPRQWLDFMLEVKHKGKCDRTLTMSDADGKKIRERVVATLLSPPHFLLPVMYVQTLK